MPDVLEWNVCEEPADGSDENEGRPSLEGPDMVLGCRRVQVLRRGARMASVVCCATQATVQWAVAVGRDLESSTSGLWSQRRQSTARTC